MWTVSLLAGLLRQTSSPLLVLWGSVADTAVWFGCIPCRYWTGRFATAERLDHTTLSTSTLKTKAVMLLRNICNTAQFQTVPTSKRRTARTWETLPRSEFLPLSILYQSFRAFAVVQLRRLCFWHATPAHWAIETGRWFYPLGFNVQWKITGHRSSLHIRSTKASWHCLETSDTEHPVTWRHIPVKRTHLKQRLFPYTTWNGWFLQSRYNVFTARYELNLYI